MKSIIAWVILLEMALPVQGQARKLVDIPCQNYEKTKEELNAAKAIWAAPPCYDFTYTFTGFQNGTPSPKSVQVRNGVLSGEGAQNIDYFFDLIEAFCVRDCPTSGAARCFNTFSDKGIPTKVEIDISKFSPDGARNYIISDFAVVECSSSIHRQIQNAEDRFVDNQLCNTVPF